VAISFLHLLQVDGFVILKYVHSVLTLTPQEQASEHRLQDVLAPLSGILCICFGSL
jgi:hypothetical protein